MARGGKRTLILTAAAIAAGGMASAQSYDTLSDPDEGQYPLLLDGTLSGGGDLKEDNSPHSGLFRFPTLLDPWEAFKANVREKTGITFGGSLGVLYQNYSEIPSFNPQAERDSVGQKFTLIDNDGTDAVTGTFNGYAEGDLVLVGDGQRGCDLRNQHGAFRDVAFFGGDAERANRDPFAFAIGEAQIIEHVGEVATGNEVHRQREGAIDFDQAVHGHDGAVAQIGIGHCLAAEAFDVALAEGQAACHDLQRDAAIERLLRGEVDNTHAAAAEFFLDQEVAEGSAVLGFGGWLLPFLMAEQAIKHQELAALRQDVFAQMLCVGLGKGRRIAGVVGAVLFDEGFDRPLDLEVVRRR